MLQPTPLPPNPFDQGLELQLHNAFNSCTRLENAQAWGTFSDELAKPQPEDIMLKTTPQVAGRTLGYALIYAPTQEGRECVAREINSCEDNPEILAGLAHLYIFGLIRIFRNPKGPTPGISADLSPRMSFEEAAEEHSRTMARQGQTPKWLRDQLLRRDGHCCKLSNKFDIRSYDHSAQPVGPLSLGFLDVVHIISQSFTEGVGGLSATAQEKLRWASSAAAVLDRFGGIRIQEILNNLDVHLPANTMIAALDAHKLFDELGLWLTPAVDNDEHIVPDAYSIEVRYPSYSHVGILERTQFHHSTTDDGEAIPPPHPRLLAIHAACARVAHLSGAAKVLDEFDGDGSAPLGLALGCQDMSVNPDGASELIHALDRVVLKA